MTSPHKITFFGAVYTLCFVAFLFVSLTLDAAILNGIETLSFSTFFWFFLLLFLQVIAIVFLAIIPSSRLLILLPLVLTFLAGAATYSSPFLTILTLGIPFALLFWTVYKNIKTRIKLRMTEDVRRPITTFFVFVIFFGSFALAPRYEHIFQNLLLDFVGKSLPAELQSSSAGTTKSLSDIIDEAIESQLVRCEGDTQCEALLRQEAERQFRQGVEQFPMLGQIDLSSDAPIAEGITDQVTEHMKNGLPFSNPYVSNLSSSFFWGIISFLVFSPLSIVLSFFSMLLVRLFYAFFRMTGVLHITTKNVQQEIIV